LKSLTSERDQNFLVELATPEYVVLKITNSCEAADVTDFQTAALLHVADRDPDFPVPRVKRTLTGETQTSVAGEDGREHSVRLLTWLDGIPLRFATTMSETSCTANLGAFLARLGMALHDFEHAASEHMLMWDLKHADKLVALLPEIADRELREICSTRLRDFAELIQPAMKQLRGQVIYNDLNPSNVLVNPEAPQTITGIIDFGDLVRSPLVNDVAVAAAYLCDNDDTLLNIVSFLRGYHECRSLQPVEIELLYDLMITRSVMTLVITLWRAAQYPGNRDYILRNESRARSTIDVLSGLGRARVTDIFLNACHVKF
jgi:Ser/Thr protein kinase RdoA (MazF antagonist)